MRFVGPLLSPLVIGVILSGSACMRPIELDAEGFACRDASECDETTICISGLCRLRPGPHTTGVPPGTVLTVQPGDQNFSVAGATVENKDILGCVRISASNVTLRRSRVTCNGYVGIAVDPGVTETRIEDVQIRSEVQTDTLEGFSGDESTLVRMDVSGFAIGVSLGANSTLRDSSLHDLADASKGAIEVLGGSNVHLENNVVRRGGTNPGPCLRVWSLSGPLSDVWVELNDLDQGLSLVELTEGTGGAVTDVHIVNNRLGRGYVEGPLVVNGVSSAVDIRGNTFSDTGEPFP